MTPKHTLQLARKPSTDEWVVVWRINGKCNEDRSYYTDDRGDAMDTMKLMQVQADALNKEESPCQLLKLCEPRDGHWFVIGKGFVEECRKKASKLEPQQVAYVRFCYPDVGFSELPVQVEEPACGCDYCESEE